MNTVARISPAEYVDKLHDLSVPGYKGEPSGKVSISTYLSANQAFGGAANANALAVSMLKIAKARNEFATINRPDFSRIFSGQGNRDNFVVAMSFINKYQDDFKAEKPLAKYFKTANFLQAMIDDKCFGLDCIGFVGGWLVEACLESSYQPRKPLDYAYIFKPVKSLDAVTDNAIVMLTNGMHIQVIDYVKSRDGNKITVDLCQSSSGGPQRNIGVTIHSGGGSYLPVDEFRKALATNQYDAAWKADNLDRQSKGMGAREYETYLRATMTQSNARFGYCGGAIFTITADGSPHNPVGGSVYIGTAGVTVGPPM